MADDEQDKPSTAAPKAEDNSENSSDDDDDDDLVLEGVIVRNVDASDSSESDDDDDDDDEDDGDNDEPDGDRKPAAKHSLERGSRINDKSKNNNSKASDMANPMDNNTRNEGSKRKRHKTRKEPKPEIVNVDFTFCDMDERYFHGLKTLLTSSSPVYATHSSALADLMIENAAVGTVVSTEVDIAEGNVYAFASVLNVTTYQDHDCIQSLKRLCLSKCPLAHKTELEVVLSGKTARPAGFYLQSRMVNLPLEIVQILHDQLVQDMDWAVNNVEGGEEERKSLNFGAFVRLAPSYRSSGSTYFKYFDDEVFAQRAEFTYDIELPKSLGMEETPFCTVMVLTKTGHGQAMTDLEELVNGSG